MALSGPALYNPPGRPDLSPRALPPVSPPEKFAHVFRAATNAARRRSRARRRRTLTGARDRPLLALGHHRVGRRRHHHEDARRRYHELEQGCRAHLRLHRRGGDRKAREHADPRGPPRRGAVDPGAPAARRADRTLRDGAGQERRLARRHLTDRLADPRGRRGDRRGLEDRPRHHRAQARGEGAKVPGRGELAARLLARLRGDAQARRRHGRARARRLVHGRRLGRRRGDQAAGGRPRRPVEGGVGLRDSRALPGRPGRAARRGARDPHRGAGTLRRDTRFAAGGGGQRRRAPPADA